LEDLRVYGLNSLSLSLNLLSNALTIIFNYKILSPYKTFFVVALNLRLKLPTFEVEKESR